MFSITNTNQPRYKSKNPCLSVCFQQQLKNIYNDDHKIMKQTKNKLFNGKHPFINT